MKRAAFTFLSSQARFWRGVLTLSLALGVLAAACSPLTPTPTPTATPALASTSTPVAPVETATRPEVQEEALRNLEVVVWHPWLDVEAHLFASQVESFNQTNPWGIRVLAVGQSGYANLFENVTAVLPTPRRPNLVIALPEHARLWDERQAVADLLPYLNDSRYGLPDVADFPPVFWQQDLAGERRLGLPAQRSAQVLLWNQTWAGELGFDTPPLTPADFRLQACRANQALRADAEPQNDAAGGWLLDSSPMTAFSWLLAFGGGVLEGGDYRFLTPQNIQALTFVRQLVDDGCAWQSAEPAATLFANRSALFISAGVEDLPDVSRALAAAGNTDTWQVLPFPGETGGVLAVYGSSYVMLKADPPHELATWLFLRWLLTPENDARRVEATGLFPLRSSTLSLLTAYQASHPQWAQSVKLLPFGQIQPQLASWRTVKVMLGDGFAHIFRFGVPAGQVAAVLAQMESTARELSK
jgi:ABC-type glycerol-3-phosphate transport system substrate-binding protein